MGYGLHTRVLLMLLSNEHSCYVNILYRWEKKLPEKPFLLSTVVKITDFLKINNWQDKTKPVNLITNRFS